MPFKVNIGNKGKTFKVEVDNEGLLGKKIGEKIDGKDINADLDGYVLEIRGTSDKAGFPGKEDVEGPALKRVLLQKGFDMKKRPRKEGKGKKRRLVKGLRLKRTVRGNMISRDTVQINVKVDKEGGKKLDDIFADQIKSKEAEKAPEQPAPTEAPAEQPAAEEKKEEPKAEEKPAEEKKDE